MTAVERNGLRADLEKSRAWQRRSAERYAAKQRATVEISRRGARVTVRRTPIRPISDRRRVEAAVYRVRRVAFLEAAEFRCGFPSGCAQRATTIQHRAGRVGDLYLDETLWAASCAAHNAWAEDHPAESKRIGWSLPRVGTA